MPVPASFQRAFTVLERCVASGLVPGAAAAVGNSSGVLHQASFGKAQVVPRHRSLPATPLWDLASLTKIVVTVTCLLRLVERGDLYLGQRVAGIIPAFGAAGKGELTVRQLLTHTSGLPAWRDLYSEGQDRATALAQVYAEPLERPSGTAVVYSDLNFIALGEVLSTLSGYNLAALARQEVFGPLSMNQTSFTPSAQLARRCVPTEVSGGSGKGKPLVGVVHDENARALGGVSGHAGLFSTCADLARFCQMWLGGGELDGERFLSRATILAATRDQTGLAQRRGLGWVLQPNPFWVPADLCSPRAYSHTGFTGTSLLLDPEFDRFAVLLTNRVHPSREQGSAERIRLVRGRFHDAVWASPA